MSIYFFLTMVSQNVTFEKVISPNRIVKLTNHVAIPRQMLMPIATSINVLKLQDWLVNISNLSQILFLHHFNRV